jgi:hypothetical protein
MGQHLHHFYPPSAIKCGGIKVWSSFKSPDREQEDDILVDGLRKAGAKEQ